MAVSLRKNEGVSLSKGLSEITVGLGWKANQFEGGCEVDLDTSAFLLNEDDRCPTEKDFIFYLNLKHPSGSVVHMGDDRTGSNSESADDDEEIHINLKAIPDMIKKIAITVTIYDAEERNQNFGQVENAYVHVIDNSTKREILRYDLTDNYFGETALVVAEFIKSENNIWTFKAVGQGFRNGLEGLCNRYGIDVK